MISVSLLEPRPCECQVTSCDLYPCSCSLSALGPNTYAAFQASNDLKDVVQRAMQRGKLDRQLSVKASLMTPVKPMLV